jgi:PAS domain S-box-containing protein
MTKIAAFGSGSDDLNQLKTLIGKAFPHVKLFTDISGKKIVPLSLAEKPDVILLELDFPGVDIPKICSQLKVQNSLKTIPVVMITNPGTDKRKSKKAIEAGADGFLVKPFDELILTAHLRTFFRLKELNEVQQISESVSEPGKKNSRKIEKSPDSKELERAFKDEQNFLKLVLDNLPIGVAVNSVDPEVKFEYMNDNFPKFYRTTREKLSKPGSFAGAVYEDPVFREKIKKRILEDIASKDPERMYWPDIPITRKGKITKYITARNIPLLDSKMMVSIVWDVTDYKKVEESTKESEEKYRTLLDVSTDAVFLNQNNKITYLNPAAIKLFGAKTAAQMIGKSPLALFHPDYHEIIKKRIARMLKDGVAVELVEEKIIRLDGSIIDVEVAASPFTLKGERAIQVVLHDINDRKKAELDRQIAYNRTRIIADLQNYFLKTTDFLEIYKVIPGKIMELIGEGIALTTILDPEEETFRMVSFAGLTISIEKVIKILGFDPRKQKFHQKDYKPSEIEVFSSGKFELLKDGISALTARKIPKTVCKVAEKLLNIKTVYTMGFVSQEKYFGGLIILAKNDISQFKSSIEVIINLASIALQRIRSEEALKISEEKFSKAFHNIPDIILISSIDDGKILEVNDTITRIGGYPKDEVVGKTTIELNFWGNLKDRDVYIAQLKKHSRVENFETTFRTKSGETFIGLISGEFIHIQGEQCILSVVHDISDRKIAEKSLKESEEKYRTIHEAALIGLYRTSLEGKYISVNPALSMIFGFSSPEEMMNSINNVGKQQYVRPEERERFIKILEQDGRVDNYPIQIFRKDKIKIWISISAHPVLNPDKSIRFIEGSVLDITGQKEAEKELRESEEKYRKLVETMPDGIYRSTHAGKFVDVNPAMVKMLGYNDKEDLLSIDIKNQLYFNASDRDSDILEEQLEESAVYPLRKKDGSEIWVEDHGWLILDEKGKPKFHEGILRDVTERKRMEELLRNSEELYRTLLNASPEATIMFDIKGKIIEVSEITPGVLRYKSKADLIGKSFLQFMPHPEIQKIRDIINESQSSGKVKNFEIQIIRSDKSAFIAEISLTSINDSSGKPTAFVVILRDISERKNMEIQFIHNARLVSLGEMATSIAHEINQPLNIISLSLDNIFNEVNSKKPVDEEYMKSKSEKIFSNIVRIRNIIDHVRAFSRDHEDYEPSLFDIHESITNAVSMVSEQFKHKAIELQVNLDKSIQSITGNMYKFEQVILNLLVNARDAVEERKEITLVEYHMNIEIQTCQEGEFIIIAVKDNGIGIKSNELDKVLLPFYTTKVVGKGTGLGLAICYRIIEEMNGKIEIDSKIYVGTTFRIKLPKVETTE